MSKDVCLVLFRKSSFHPEPVVCAVFRVKDGFYVDAKSRILNWQEEFIRRFPEFKSADFYTEESEII